MSDVGKIQLAVLDSWKKCFFLQVHRWNEELTGWTQNGLCWKSETEKDKGAWSWCCIRSGFKLSNVWEKGGHLFLMVKVEVLKGSLGAEHLVIHGQISWWGHQRLPVIHWSCIRGVFQSFKGTSFEIIQPLICFLIFLIFHEFTSQSWISSPSETCFIEANCTGFEIKLNPWTQVFLEIEHSVWVIEHQFQISGLQEYETVTF